MTLWPFFDLVVRTPRIELRYPSDDDLAQLAACAAEGIHAAHEMPFYVPWTRRPSPDLERGLLQWAWTRRGSLTADNWGLPLVVVEGGTVVGTQDLHAVNFGVTRSVETGSWLVRRAQGHGLGKEMRAAVLHLAFEGLGASEACTASFEDNPRSEAVTRALGYEPNGAAIFAREGRPVRTNKWRLGRERWQAQRRDDIVLEHLAPCRSMLDSAWSGGAGARGRG